MLFHGPFRSRDINNTGEIARASLKLVEQIGEGQFGSVFKAMIDEASLGGAPEYIVAAKTVRLAASGLHETTVCALRGSP
jgi:hypothetical protein